MSDNKETRAAHGTARIGDYVSWTEKGDTYVGEIIASVQQGSINVPGSAIHLEGSRLDPALLIQIYTLENGVWLETDMFVAKHESVVQPAVMEAPVEEIEDEMDESLMQRNAPIALTGRMKLENLRRARGKGVSKVETRVTATQFEIREEAEGMRFSGYAAVFNSPSEPLPFTEVIERGAFHKTLRSKNDVKFLWNHDSGEILGSTRAKTLSLIEDERGLRVEGLLPNTSRGRDVAELLRRGDVDSMSFGFSVPSGGDDWSKDGAQRTLKSVRLHEVSLVAFPAYPGTAGLQSVRGLDKIAQRAEVDPDQLADAWIKVEEGQTLTEEEGRLLKQVVDALVPPAEEAEAVEAAPDLSMLELKKKKLALLTGKVNGN